MGKKEKKSASEELFGDHDELLNKKVLKLEEKPFKSLKQIEKESKEPRKELVVSDFKDESKPFRQSSAAEDPIFQQDVSVEEGLGRMLGTITDPKNIEHFSEFDEQEVIALAACEAINDKIQSRTLGVFLHEFKSHRVSSARKGRMEIVEIARSMMGAAEAKASGILNSVKSVFGR